MRLVLPVVAEEPRDEHPHFPVRHTRRSARGHQVVVRDVGIAYKGKA